MARTETRFIHLPLELLRALTHARSDRGLTGPIQVDGDALDRFEQAVGVTVPDAVAATMTALDCTFAAAAMLTTAARAQGLPGGFFVVAADADDAGTWWTALGGGRREEDITLHRFGRRGFDEEVPLLDFVLDHAELSADPPMLPLESALLLIHELESPERRTVPPLRIVRA